MASVSLIPRWCLLGRDAYRSRDLHTNPWCHKSKHNTAKSNTKPKASGRHSTRKGLSASNPGHEDDNPSSKGDFDTDVEQKEECANPRYSSRRHRQDRRGQSGFPFDFGLIVDALVGSAVDAPEGPCQGHHFNRSEANLQLHQHRFPRVRAILRTKM